MWVAIMVGGFPSNTEVEGSREEKEGLGLGWICDSHGE